MMRNFLLLYIQHNLLGFCKILPIANVPQLSRSSTYGLTFAICCDSFLARKRECTGGQFYTDRYLFKLQPKLFLK